MPLSQVASAPTLDLDGRPAYEVTGTDTIDTINGFFDGQEVSLFSADGFTLGNAGNVEAQVPLVPVGQTVTLRQHDDILVEIGRHLIGSIEDRVPSSRLINTTAPLTGGGDLSSDLTLGFLWEIAGANGSKLEFLSQTEEITLSTAGLTTDSTADLVGGPGLIWTVSARWTQALAGATSASFGDSIEASRFGSLAAGSGALLNHWQGNVSTRQKGPVTTAPAKLRLTTDAIPSAGKVRVHTVSLVVTPPTS